MPVSLRSILLAFSLLIMALPAQAAMIAIATPVKPAKTPPTTEQMHNLNRQVLEQQLGRKLTFKERIALGVTKRKLRKEQRRAQKGKAKKGKQSGFGILGFVLGLVGLVIAGVLLSVILIGTLAIVGVVFVFALLL
jgi:Flp pilus assembly protein TadB